MIKKKIAFSTLGCKLNQFESDSLISNFIKSGYDIVPFNEKADVYIINTCTVTNKSDAKSRNMIHRVKRLNSNALLFVTGCYAETDRSSVEQMDGVDSVVGNDKKYDLFNIIHRSLNKELIDIEKIKGDRFQYQPAEHTSHTRSFLKIQDGCNEYCTYCKIPLARGQAESRSYQDILDSVKSLIQFGYKEIIFTGINIGGYFYKGKTLTSLLESVLELKGEFRVHLSSIEPNKITSSLISLLEHPKICSHLHIPLQSGSNRILELMGRNYTLEYFKRIVNQIREKDHSINITTDVMTGFPSETDSDFNETLSVIKELKITHTHTFKYSSREGTQAAKLKEQIPEKIKSLRSQIIRQMSEELNLTYKKKLMNHTVRVLTEKKIGESLYTGYSDHYIRIQYYDKIPVIGGFRNVKITEVTPEKILANIID